MAERGRDDLSLFLSISSSFYSRHLQTQRKEKDGKGAGEVPVAVAVGTVECESELLFTQIDGEPSICNWQERSRRVF